MKKFSEQEIQAARDQHDDWLMRQPGVIGSSVGLGRDGDVRLRIFTTQLSESTRREIQSRIGGVPIDWDEGDEVVAY